MRIAREGFPFIAGALLIGAGLAFLAPLAVTLLWLVVTLWVIAFFRDPARPGPRGERLVIAPADGKVVSIIPIHEPDVIGGPAQRISIFMNVFDVHVNRYPVDGDVIFTRHRPGKFFNAAAEKAALENEQSDIGQRGPLGPVLSRQIAGLVARRIVTDHATGFAGEQGERMGLIRFGSRVDVFVPPEVTVMVRVGDRTTAGVTVIAQWN